METNRYQGLRLMQDGTPMGDAWVAFVKESLERNTELLARAESESEIFRLQGKHRLYKEMITLPITIKRSTEND